jgi:hypothetical protein
VNKQRGHQNVEKIRSSKVPNKSFETVAKFKYFGARVTNQNNIHKEIKSRKYLPVILYVSKPWSFTLREDRYLISSLGTI